MDIYLKENYRNKLIEILEKMVKILKLHNIIYKSN